MIKGSATIPTNILTPGGDLKNLFHLFSKAPVGMAFYTGPSFIVGFINDATLNAWGKIKDEVLGKPFFEIFPDLLKTQLPAIMTKVFTSGENFSAKEYELMLPKGEKTIVRYFNFALEPVNSAQNTVLGILSIATDVTTEVSSRKKIKESEESFRTLANEAPMFVWVTDENLQTTYINKTGLDYFGFAPNADFASISWKQFIHPDDIKRVLSTMKEAASQKRPYTLEMRLKNSATDQYRWFLDKGMPRFHHHKEFVGFIGSSLDIQDRKEAEEILENKVRVRTSELDYQNRLLQQQNELVRSILDSTLDLIAVYDADTRIIAINHTALNEFERLESQVIGKKLLEVFPEFTGSNGNDDLLKALNGETVHNDNYQSPVTGKYYENLMIPLRTDDQKVYAVLAIAHDNTILINKNKELNEVQQIAQLGSWDWDPATNKINWSDQMYHIYGYDKDPSPISFEKAVERMLPLDALNARQRTNKQIIEAHKLFEEKGETVLNTTPWEYPIFLPDGSKKILRGAGKIILSPDGKLTKVIGTVLDITENLKQLEELKKLNESDKLKSDFIKMASHELKTPITSIKGYVQLLLTAIQREKEDDQDEGNLSPLLIKSSLVSIDKQTTRLTRLMSELLDLSKIESGMLDLDKEVFSLNEAVIETVQDILYTNSKHSIQIYHDFECKVYCDKDRLGQVLINLLTNAIKYSPYADKIEIWIRKVGNDHSSVSVKDYGIGIDSKYHDRIFERFYRAEGKEEQTFPGFGIGLFIAKEIMQRHEGAIYFDSEKGKGSIFTIELPIVI